MTVDSTHGFSKKPRRARGSVVDPVIPGWLIERSTKERVELIADRALVSASELADLMVANLQVTDQGVPSWLSPRDGKRSRTRGSLADPVMAGWRVERVTKDRVAAIAKHAGLSASELVELIVAHIDLTDQGIPSWMPERSRDGELPIDVL